MFTVNLILFASVCIKNPGFIKKDDSIDFQHAVEAVSEEIHIRKTHKINFLA